MALTGAEKQKRWRLKQKKRLQMVKDYELFFNKMELVNKYNRELNQLADAIIRRQNEKK